MKRRIFQIIFLATLGVTLFEEIMLRPFLQRNEIDFLYLVDSLPNFLAVVLLCFGTMALLAYTKKQEIIKCTAGYTIGIILYEVLQLVMPGRVFDLNDMVASLLGGAFSYLVIFGIDRFIHRDDTALLPAIHE